MIAVPDNEYVIDVTIDYDSKILKFKMLISKKLVNLKKKFLLQELFVFFMN